MTASAITAEMFRNLPPAARGGRDDLTDRQRMILEWIQAFHHEHSIMPTLREIGAAIGIRSTNGVNDHLRALERKGYLTRVVRTGRCTARAIHLTPKTTGVAPFETLVVTYGSVLRSAERLSPKEIARLIYELTPLARAGNRRWP